MAARSILISARVVARSCRPESVSSAIRSTPLVADWTGDGVPDVIELDGRGQILFRRGQAGERGAFEPPIILNPAPLPPATDLAWVVTPAGPLLAALDARDDAVWLYRVAPNGALDLVAQLAIPGNLPTRIVAGDLNGDGRDDLAVICAGSDQVMVYLQGHPGVVGPMPPAPMGFGRGPDFQVDIGVSPSDLALTDVNGDHRLDIVVSDLVSGDISVVLNDPSQPFSRVLRYRSGTGAYAADRNGQAVTVHSDEAPLGLVAGPFAGGPGNDLVVINSNSQKLTLLPALGEGGFGTPRNLLTFPRDPARRPSPPATSTATASPTWPSWRRVPGRSPSIAATVPGDSSRPPRMRREIRPRASRSRTSAVTASSTCSSATPSATC